MISKTLLASDIFTLDNVLSKRECKDLIIFSEQKGYEDAAVNLGGKQVINKSIRNNSRLIYDDFKLSQMLWKRISEFIPKEIDSFQAYGLNERLRFYKYDAGQRFNKHRDGSFVRGIGDMSILTFMIYLNEDFEGGNTTFDKDDIVVKPKTGSALIFIHPLKHTGTEVTKGEKYAIRSDVMYRKDMSNE
jgi:predicted 2-oxoglutarate/Fe(II)-dependent dioxygenase YbiX